MPLNWQTHQTTVTGVGLALFRFLGKKIGKMLIFIIQPYEECECHQDASFELLTALIGPTGQPKAVRMRH